MKLFFVIFSIKIYILLKKQKIFFRCFIVNVGDYHLEIKYLQNLFIESNRTFANFKKENVLNSATLKEMFTPKYIYRGDKPNTYLVKSLKTNQPVEIKAIVHKWRNTFRNLGTYIDTYRYRFYDKSKNELGYKSFYIGYDPSLNKDSKEMHLGYMENKANELYRGIGIRADQIQIKAALDNNIKYIPRSSLGFATLYHTKMGFLPVTDDLLEVKSEFDVNRYMRGLNRGSKDIKLKNIQPIIIKKGGKYFIDVSKTQAVANVAEIKGRLAEGYSYADLETLDLDGIPLMLSGKELEYWKNLINSAYSAQYEKAK